MKKILLIALLAISAFAANTKIDFIVSLKKYDCVLDTWKEDTYENYFRKLFSARGSRIHFSVYAHEIIKAIDKEKINREALTSLGVTSIVMMSDKVTLVTNLDNQKIVENMKNSLQK